MVQRQARQPAPAWLRGLRTGFADCLRRGKGNFGLAAVFAYKIASFSAVGLAVFRLENIRCGREMNASA
jgi:hypothetical protein